MRHFTTSAVVKALREACAEHDLKLTTTYSGRAMYGKQCIGFITDRYCDRGAFCSVFGALQDLKDHADSMGGDLEEQVEELFEAIASGTSKEDSMGLGQIIYFPMIEAPDAEEEEEELH